MPPRTTSTDLALRIGRRVREVRESCGFTQEGAAWAADLSKGYLSRVESGKHLPSLEALQRLAEGLSVSLYDFLIFPSEQARDRVVELTRFATESELATGQEVLTASRR